VEQPIVKPKGDEGFNYKLNTDLIKLLPQMKEIVRATAKGGKSDTQISDARPSGFDQGHILGAKSINFKDLLGSDGVLKSDSEIRKIFEKAGFDLKKPIVNSCGAGITAAVHFVALTRMGLDKVALYDGSWSEYVSIPSNLD